MASRHAREAERQERQACSGGQRGSPANPRGHLQFRRQGKGPGARHSPPTWREHFAVLLRHHHGTAGIRLPGVWGQQLGRPPTLPHMRRAAAAHHQYYTAHIIAGTYTDERPRQRPGSRRPATVETAEPLTGYKHQNIYESVQAPLSHNHAGTTGPHQHQPYPRGDCGLSVADQKSRSHQALSPGGQRAHLSGPAHAADRSPPQRTCKLAATPRAPKISRGESRPRPAGNNEGERLPHQGNREARDSRKEPRGGHHRTRVPPTRAEPTATANGRGRSYSRTSSGILRRTRRCCGSHTRRENCEDLRSPYGGTHHPTSGNRKRRPLSQVRRGRSQHARKRRRRHWRRGGQQRPHMRISTTQCPRTRTQGEVDAFHPTLPPKQGLGRGPSSPLTPQVQNAQHLTEEPKPIPDFTGMISPTTTDALTNHFALLAIERTGQYSTAGAVLIRRLLFSFSSFCLFSGSSSSSPPLSFRFLVPPACVTVSAPSSLSSLAPTVSSPPLLRGPQAIQRAPRAATIALGAAPSPRTRLHGPTSRPCAEGDAYPAIQLSGLARPH